MQLVTQFSGELEAVWREAFRNDASLWPYYAFSWHRMWHRTLARDESLCIAWGGDAVLPLSIHKGVLHFTGGEEIADYLDAVGPDTQKAALWKTLLTDAPSNGASSLLLRNIPDGSATLAFFRSLPGARIEQEDTTPVAVLPGSFDAFLESLNRKNRHELRRKMRKFTEAYPDTTLAVHEPADADISTLLSLMRRNDEKTYFLTDSMERFFLALPAIPETALLQFSLIRPDRTVIASLVSFRVGESLLLYNSGFDPGYVGAGLYLKARTIDWAIAHGIRRYNFLQGGERYKYELGGVDHPVWRVTMEL